MIERRRRGVKGVFEEHALSFEKDGVDFAIAFLEDAESFDVIGI